MRPSEILTILVAALAAAALVVGERLGADLRWTAAPAAIALAAAIVARPFRWQMIPAWLVLAAAGAGLALGLAPTGIGAGAFATLAALACAVSAVLAAGFPLRKLPAPDGPFAVGAVTTTLARPSDEPEAAERRLLVKLWYPAEAARETNPSTYEPLWSELYTSRSTPLPVRLFTSYLAGIRTHTRKGAPLRAGAPYPIVIYSHGLVSFPSESTLLMESLASHGCIVASVSPVDQLTELRRMQRSVPAAERARDKALFAGLKAAADRAERARLFADIYANSTGMTKIVRLRSEDLAFVADRLPDVLAAIPGGAEASPGGDGDRIAAVGFSLGGAVAMRWSKIDRRCRAVVNIDGGAFDDRPDEPVGAPCLMIYREETAGANDVLKARSSTAFEDVTLPGASHADFTDAAVLAPLLKRIGVLGRVQGDKVVRERNTCVRRFLDAHLA